MKLFENENVGIAKIYTVNKYDSESESSRTGTIFYNVNLPTYELVFFLDGKAITNYAGTVITDKENSVRYMPKGITDGEYRVDKIEHVMCIDIYFDTDDPMPMTAIGLYDLPVLKKLFIKLYNVWQDKKAGYYAEAMSIFYKIIAEIKRSDSGYKQRSHLAKIDRARDYMLTRYCDADFDYREMCAASGLSYDRFKELFKAAYGSSPVKYVTSLRITKAKELLITGHYSITEIAEACGFENIYYFSTVFKKETGVPPSKYLSHKLI